MSVGGAAVQSESLWNGLLDNNGDPLASGNVYIYQAGTTTASTLYTTADAGTAHANPLVLDAYGRAQAYGNRDYKFIVTDVSGTTLYTMDDIAYNYWKEDNDGTGTGLDADLLDAGNTYNSDGVMVKITKPWRLAWKYRLMYAWSILWRGTL